MATLELFLSEMFVAVSKTIVPIETTNDEGDSGNASTETTIFGLSDDKIRVTVGKSRGVAIVEWEASPANDVIADAVIALLMHAQSSAASIRLTSKPCCHPRAVEVEDEPSAKKPKTTAESRLRLIRDALLDQFEKVEAVYDAGNKATYEISIDCPFDSEVVLGEDGTLPCIATVEFHDDLGIDATITVECEDKKLAHNVQECLRNLAAVAAPITV
jgi:hypothetical protein